MFQSLPKRLRTSTRSLATLLLLGGVLFAAGCERQPAQTPAPIAATPAVDQPATDAFVLLDAGSDDRNGRPALWLRFSQPLIAEQNFDELVLVRDDKGADVPGSWVLDDDDAQVLRFPYVQGDKTYTVSL